MKVPYKVMMGNKEAWGGSPGSVDRSENFMIAVTTLIGRKGFFTLRNKKKRGETGKKKTSRKSGERTRLWAKPHFHKVEFPVLDVAIVGRKSPASSRGVDRLW